MDATNHFLASLSPADLDLLQPGLKRVSLKRDQPLAELGQPVRDAYLPIDCVVSVVTVMRDGRAVESRTIGREGGFGLLHALGSELSFESVTAQIAGSAFRISLPQLADAASRSPSLVRHIVQHAQATIVQTAQTTGCNALHDVRQRLCRWLLLTQDRVGGPVLPLTQEHLSIMLGVQRTTVTAIASQLQKEGHIGYSRGRMTIRDRDALRRLSCECYAAIEHAAGAVIGEPIRVQ